METVLYWPPCKGTEKPPPTVPQSTVKMSVSPTRKEAFTIKRSNSLLFTRIVLTASGVALIAFGFYVFVANQSAMHEILAVSAIGFGLLAIGLHAVILALSDANRMLWSQEIDRVERSLK